MKTYDFQLPLAFLRSAGECIEGTYQEDDYGFICDRLYLGDNLVGACRVSRVNCRGSKIKKR